MRPFIVALSVVSLVPSIAVAQDQIAECIPTRDRPCFTLKPLEIVRNNAINPPSNVELLDPSELLQTYECSIITGQKGTTTGPLIENCGSPATLSNVRPYFGIKQEDLPEKVENAVTDCEALGFIAVPAALAAKYGLQGTAGAGVYDTSSEVFHSATNNKPTGGEVVCIDPNALLAKTVTQPAPNFAKGATTVTSQPSVQVTASVPQTQKGISTPTILSGAGSFGGFGGGSSSNQTVIVEQGGGGNTFIDRSVTDNRIFNEDNRITKNVTKNTTNNNFGGSTSSSSTSSSSSGGSSSTSSSSSGGVTSSASSSSSTSSSSSGGVESSTSSGASSSSTSSGASSSSSSSGMTSSGMTSSGMTSSGMTSSGMTASGMTSSGANSFSSDAGQVPEPAPLLLIALAGLTGFLRRKKT